MTPNASGRPNRVAPDGSTHAVADRGLVWGNRGRLLNAHGEVARHHLGRNWIVCVLEFRGRHRTQWQPNRLTEQYFLDEPTALAAGHRPCGECRNHDYQRFKRAWEQAHPDDGRGAKQIDRRLHADRWDADGGHRIHRAGAADLPDGVVIAHDDALWLVRGSLVHRWSLGGYRDPRPRSELPDTIDLLTPRATVATLRAGYDPVAHPSASRSPGASVDGSTPTTEGQVP